MKFSRKSKGVISVFLILILVPTMVMSAMLVDASRVRSAKAMAQEASDLAAYSVLSAYDGTLKDLYGLLAFEDDEQLMAIMEESLKATLSASDLGVDAEYSEKIWNILKDAMGAGSSFQGKKFLNLYDFQVEGSSVTAEHNLANPSVLQSQIVEYSKYRGLYVIAERMNLLANLSAVSEASSQMKEAEKAMEAKMNIDEANDALDKAVLKVNQAAQQFNGALDKDVMNRLKEDCFDSITAKMEMAQEEAETPEGEAYEEDSDKAEQAELFTERKQALVILYDQIEDSAKELEDAAREALAALKNAEESLNGYINQYSGTAQNNETVQELVKDARETLKRYQEEYRPSLEAIRDHASVTSLANAKLGQKVSDLLNQIRTRAEDFKPENQKTSDENSYGFRYLKAQERTPNSTAVIYGTLEKGGYETTYDYLVSGAMNVGKVPEFNPYEDKDQDQDGRDKAKDQMEQAKKQEEKQKDSNHARRSVPQAIYSERPSKKYGYKAAEAAGIPSYNDRNLSDVKEVFGGNDSFLDNLVETTRDEALTMSYVFGTFKTRMTANDKFKKSNAPSGDKPYVADWRYMYEDGEHDMRFTAKKNRETQLTAEIEYIVYGQQSDLENEILVYSTIWGTRMANNMIALYCNKEVKSACKAAAWATAAAVSAATAGLGAAISPEVYFWIFLAAWAAAETTLDLSYLIDDGYYIPLIKTKDNILLTVDFEGTADGDGSLVDHYNMDGSDATIASKIKVCYEDYLLLLLMFQSSDSRLMRIGDLVEMNMRKSDDGFRLSEANTYINSSTDLSIRYLFSADSVLGTEYKENGIGDRIHFNSTIYLGY